MTAVRLLPEAEEELRAAARFYEAEQSGLGRALLQEVRRVLRLIAERPLAARIERAEIRIRTIARFPYRVYYRAGPDEILVVAIGHRHRRPGYWRSLSHTKQLQRCRKPNRWRGASASFHSALAPRWTRGHAAAELRRYTAWMPHRHSAPSFGSTG